MIKPFFDGLEQGVKDFFTVARIALKATLKMFWKFLGQVFGVILVWLKGIPEACSEAGAEWAENANKAGMGKFSKPIGHIVRVLAFIEIVAISLLLAHVIVFITFYIILLVSGR
jgi:hypothetical protein